MGNTFVLEAQAIWRILLVSVILGAGLPTLFAAGIRAMAAGSAGNAELAGTGAATSSGTATSTAARPGMRALAYACFAVVLLVVALGIVFIVATGFGKVLSFEHVYPTIIDKP